MKDFKKRSTFDKRKTLYQKDYFIHSSRPEEIMRKKEGYSSEKKKRDFSENKFK